MSTSSRRGNNDSFRPALRFPTDPSNPSVLPSGIKQIVQPPASSSTSTAPGPATISAAQLLHSRRKPWEVDISKLEDRLGRNPGSKVVLVIGEPSAEALEPIVSSHFLRKSLVIVVLPSDSPVSLSPVSCLPSVRVLRLRPPPPPLPSSNPTPVTPPFTWTATRLNSILDWAESVSTEWRTNPVTRFATLDEGDCPLPTRKKRPPMKAPNMAVYDMASEGSQSQTSIDSGWSLGLTESRRSSLSAASFRKMLRGGDSSGSLPEPSRIQTSNPTLPIPRKSLPPSKRRFSLASFTHPSQDDPLPASPAKDRPPFDAIVNFLPTAGAGQGPSDKFLLRQTVLVTTATQRFLVPVPPKLNRPRAEFSDESAGGRFRSIQQRTESVTSLPARLGRGNGGGTIRRLSGIFFSVDPPAANGTSSTTASKRRSSIFHIGSASLPTPPGSRPSSSDEEHGQLRVRPGLSGPTPSHSSQASSSNVAEGGSPKILHILPGTTNAGTSRLVRSLEAFLLSWSFGGPRGDAIDEDSPGGGVAKKTSRPFLLDTISLCDVLRMNGGEYSIADMIFSGVLDDEYTCTGGVPSPSLSSSPSPPDLTVTRTSTDRTTSLYTRPPPPNARYSLVEVPEGEGGPSWASRRAWLGGSGELMVYPGPVDAFDSRNRAASVYAGSGGGGLGIRTPPPARSEEDHSSASVSSSVKRRSLSENGFASYVPPGVGYAVNPPTNSSPMNGAPPSSWNVKGKQPVYDVEPLSPIPAPVVVRSASYTSDGGFTVTSRPRTSPDLPSLAREARYPSNTSTPISALYSSTLPSPPSPTIPTPSRSSPLRNGLVPMAPEPIGTQEKEKEKKYKFPSKKWWFAPAKVSLRLR